MAKEISMLKAFEQFIRATAKGRRCKLDGSRIKPQTVDNYRQTLKLLQDYEAYNGKELLIKTNTRNNARLIRQEQQSWIDFFKEFSRFLYYKKGCHDNYCGHVFKIIKCFFRYLRNEKCLSIRPFYDRFYVRKEDIRIITLLPEQLCFLILDEQFAGKLSPALRRVKDAFVFGCTAALRFSDLMSIRLYNIEKRGDDYFLDYRSVKTDVPVKIKLPDFAVTIFKQYASNKKPGSFLFRQTLLFRFNIYVRRIAELAGWTAPVNRFRTINGEPVELKIEKKSFRFCDQLSSHVMRRTGITILLMVGMPEYLVGKISGHAAQSKSFFRYVNFAHSYITDEISKAHAKLLALYKPFSATNREE
jgi:hypothetical protein